MKGIGYIIRLVNRKDRSLHAIICISNVMSMMLGIVPVLFSRYLFDALAGKADGYTAVKIIIFFSILLMALGFFSRYLQSVVFVRSMTLRFNLLIEDGDLYTRAEYSLLEKPSFLDLSARADRAVENSSSGIEGVLHSAATIFGNVMILLYMMVFVAIYSPILFVLIAIAVLIDICIIRRQERFEKQTEDEGIRNQRQWNYIHSTIQAPESYKELVLNSMKWLFQNDIARIRESKVFAIHKVYRKRIASHSIIEGIRMLLEMCVYLFVGINTINGNFSIGMYSSVTLACFTLFRTANTTIKEMAYMVHQAEISLDYKEYVDALTKDIGRGVNGNENTPMEEVALRGVKFTYPGTEKEILGGIDVAVKQGEKVALVGLNGAGKTTLVNIIMGLRKPTEGNVMLNGSATEGITAERYYKLFSPAFQETNLYAFTIAENVSMCPLAETDMQRVMECCKAVGLHEVISKYPNGYNQMITRTLDETGIEFSGGEKQRLGLARALYKDAPFFVLDEPTAAYDAISEAKLYELMNKITDGKSVVFISHRLASTQFCDHVLLLQDGLFLETGSHAELLAKHGAYEKLFNIQAQYYRTAEANEGGETM